MWWNFIQNIPKDHTTYGIDTFNKYPFYRFLFTYILSSINWNRYCSLHEDWSSNRGCHIWKKFNIRTLFEYGFKKYPQKPTNCTEWCFLLNILLVFHCWCLWQGYLCLDCKMPIVLSIRIMILFLYTDFNNFRCTDHPDCDSVFCFWFQ